MIRFFCAGRVRSRLPRVLGALFLACGLWLSLPPAQGQEYDYYRVNGESLPLEMQQMFALMGLPPGDYYIDEYGNFGMVGQPPIANTDGGPPRYPGGAQPSAPQAAPPQPQTAQPRADQGRSDARDGQVAGIRIFWVYSPSIFSGATGGASGYIHICPGKVFYRSSEGSFSVGGEYKPSMGDAQGGYDPTTGQNAPWAGGAGTSRNAGRWAIEDGPNGPVVALYGADGNEQRILLRLIGGGSWKAGQTKYAAERGKASCG